MHHSNKYIEGTVFKNCDTVRRKEISQDYMRRFIIMKISSGLGRFLLEITSSRVIRKTEIELEGLNEQKESRSERS